MNILKVSGLVLSISLLSACALTPAEKAAQAREHAQELLNTQVSLAQECDPETASLMAELPAASKLDPAAKQAFEKKYNAQINNPTFLACYNMAWKTYQEQNQLQIERMQAWNEANELDWDWDNGFFFNPPFGYWE